MQFDQRAEQYAEHAEVQRAMADWLTEWLPDVSQSLGSAVEFGAGEGMFTRRAWTSFQDFYAIDVAPRMVSVGQTRAPQAEWRQGDAWQGEGLGPDVDAVLSSSLMQWCPDPALIFQQWREQLKPGACMLHGFYVDPTLSELQELQGTSAAPLQWRTTDQWIEALSQAGWSIDRIETEKRCFVYRSALDFLRSLHGVGAVRRSGVRGSRLRYLIREYDRRHAVKGGGVYANWTFCRLLASA